MKGGLGFYKSNIQKNDLKYKITEKGSGKNLLLYI